MHRTRKLFLILGLTMFCSSLGLAQNVPRVEFFGGYSYSRAGFSSTNSPFFVTPTSFGQNFKMQGWDFALTENLNNWFGVTQDISGLYATPSLLGFNHQTRIYSFLSGPRFSYRGIKWAIPFAHALFGYDEMSIKIPSAAVSGSENSYGMALGGGLDIKLRGIFALRLVQADYFMTRFLGNTQNNLRFSTGVVLQLEQTSY